VLRIFFQLMIVFVSLEFLLRIIFYQQVGSDKLILIQMLRQVHQKMMVANNSEVYTFHFLARPDSSKTINREIANGFMKNNSMEYKPWAQYKVVGQQINTKEKDLEDQC
jgi:hypothetical protein